MVMQETGGPNSLAFDGTSYFWSSSEAITPSITSCGTRGGFFRVAAGLGPGTAGAAVTLFGPFAELPASQLHENPVGYAGGHVFPMFARTAPATCPGIPSFRQVNGATAAVVSSDSGAWQMLQIASDATNTFALVRDGGAGETRLVRFANGTMLAPAGAGHVLLATKVTDFALDGNFLFVTDATNGRIARLAK
jgi:hypothetical protein